MLQRSSDFPPLLPLHSGMSPSSAAKPEGGFDLREIVRVLRRRLQIVLGTPVALLVLATLFVMIVTPLFTATSTVLIDPRRTAAADLNNQPLQSNYGTDDASIESQVLLIRSIAVLQRVVDSLKLHADPEFVPPPGWFTWLKGMFAAKPSARSIEEAAKAAAIEALQGRIKVVRQRTTFVVDIEASSRDAPKAAAIANAVAQSYLLEQVRSKYDATRVAADWFNRQIGELKYRVLAADKAVEDFRAANNLMVAQGVTVNDQQITDLNNKLIEARAEASEARAKFEQVQQIAKCGADPGAIAEAVSSDMIARLRAQYAEIAKSSAELSTKYGPQHPQVAAVRAQLHDTQRLINGEVQRILQARRHNYEVAAAREASLKKSSRWPARRVDGVRSGTDPAARASTGSGREPCALRVLPFTLQGSERARDLGAAGGTRRDARGCSAAPILSEDVPDAGPVAAARARLRLRCRPRRRPPGSPGQDARAG